MLYHIGIYGAISLSYREAICYTSYWETSNNLSWVKANQEAYV